MRYSQLKPKPHLELESINFKAIKTQITTKTSINTNNKSQEWGTTTYMHQRRVRNFIASKCPFTLGTNIGILNIKKFLSFQT